MSEDEIVEQKPKSKPKAKLQRYFDAPVEESEVKKVKLIPQSQQKFEGEIIEVNDKSSKQLSKKFKFAKWQKDNNKLSPGQSASNRPKIDPKLLKKYNRDRTAVRSKGVKTGHFKEQKKRKEIYHQYATEQAARTEILLHEEQGFLEADEQETTASYRQEEIVKNVDLQSAAKHYKLNLEFGPYSMRYTKNGRHLLLGGRKGHVAAFDWITKRLKCEFNAMEEVADVCWLHVDTMFACAQKNWVHIYDNRGKEMHCVKRLYRINRMEFLPYHFLLANASEQGYLSWLDVSIGELVGNFNTKLGDIRLMRHNPANGVLCVGGGKGVVSMWSPKVREPLAKLVCHKSSMTALTVDPKGKYLLTTSMDSKIKIWDIRALKGPMVKYATKLPVNQLEVSQRGVLAYAQGNYCEMYSNLLLGEQAKTPYLKQSCDGFIQCMRFCPYEDVLGVATAKGFQSLLVPGSGEPNFDAFEDNPFQTKSQRREHEIHSLLEKLPAELITLDPNEIIAVDAPTLQEKIDAKATLFHLKPPKIDFQARHKMKGRGGSANAARNKQIVREQKRKEFVKNAKAAKQKLIKEHKSSDDFIPLEGAGRKTKPNALDRFVMKKDKTKN